MREKQYKKVRIIWKDISFFNERESIANISKYKFIEIETIGFLIFEDKDKLVVAMSLIPDKKECLDFYLIPKSNIITREVIK